jgi:acetyltransferase-like isoleucine patch superfamily enzyme
MGSGTFPAVLNRTLSAARALRFRLWARTVDARLRRLGGRFVLDLAETPRYLTLPRVEIDEGGGTLTLRIGRGCKIGRDLVLDVAPRVDGVIELGDRVTLQNGVRLQAWGGAIRLADGAQVRDRCELKSKGELTVGERAILGRNVTLHCNERVALGTCVGLAERVTIADSDHANDGSDTFFMEQPVISAPVVLEHNVFLATNVVVLRGCTVGRNTVAAAGAVLTGGEYPAGWLLGGIPARPLKPLAATAQAAEQTG